MLGNTRFISRVEHDISHDIMVNTRNKFDISAHPRIILYFFSFQANDYAVSSTVSDDEPLATPPGTTDMELKIKQVCMVAIDLLLPCEAGGLLITYYMHCQKRRTLFANCQFYQQLVATNLSILLCPEVC